MTRATQVDQVKGAGRGHDVAAVGIEGAGDVGAGNADEACLVFALGAEVGRRAVPGMVVGVVQGIFLEVAGVGYQVGGR